MMRPLLLLILLSTCLAAHAQPNALEWNKINLPGNLWVKHVQFINDSVGFAVGDGDYLLKSTDRGLHWKKIAKPYNGITEDVSFVSDDIGYAVSINDTALIKTLDGGETWFPIEIDTPIRGNNVHFVSPDTGIIATTTGDISFSYDGFINSISITELQQIIGAQMAYNLHFPSYSVGYVLTGSPGGDDAALHRSMNGGRTWQAVSPLNEFEDYSLDNQNVQFVNDSTGYTFVVNELMRSTDSGETWQTILDTGITSIIGIHFINPDTGMVFGQKDNAKLYFTYTFDGGANWHTSPFDCDIILNDVHCIDGTLNCFAFGGNGAICRTNVPDSLVSVRGGANITESHVSFAPNPVDRKGKLSISPNLLKQHESLVFRLYTVRGKLAHSKRNITSPAKTISFDQLSPGMFFYHVTDQEGRRLKTGKLVVE